MQRPLPSNSIVLPLSGTCTGIFAAFWNADYLLSAETRKHLDRENDVMKTILTDLGLAKQ